MAWGKPANSVNSKLKVWQVPENQAKQQKTG